MIDLTIQEQPTDESSLTNEELISKLKSIDKPHNGGFILFLKSTNPKLFDEIVERTSFLEPKLVSFFARIYCLEHGIRKHPTCSCKTPECHNLVEWRPKLNDFAPYCSIRCRSSDVVQKEKAKETNSRRYGCSHPMKSKAIRDKVANTVKSKYGCQNTFQVDEFKQKSKQTMLKNYGVETPMDSKEIKERVKKTNIQKFGVENPFQSKEVKERILSTMIERHGVENYAQSSEYHKNKRHRFESLKYLGNFFDSTWEVKVFEFCKDNGVEVEYQPSISFEYEHECQKHTYHPDFKINGRLYEVKGDHFFNESSEMVNPYDRTQDGLYESKHQCMLKNNIIILREQDIKHLTIEMFA